MNTLATEFDALLSDAYKSGASDIHISLHQHQISFQFRRHKKHLKVFKSENGIALFEYLKYYSGIEMRRYQEPMSVQFAYIVEDTELFCRFALLETRNQTHGVLRILNQNHIVTLEDCGFSHDICLKIHAFFEASNGLLLFTGTTGSGKSTSMFSALHEITGRQIITLENPVEQFHEHLIQLTAPPKLLGDYVTQILRHDPDIIVLGEIRTDDELLQCLRCALTGHLVVSTMHAGKMSDVTHRFKELNKTGIPLESILYGIVHQRLSHKEGEVSLEANIKLF